jgi:hypothetical protein
MAMKSVVFAVGLALGAAAYAAAAQEPVLSQAEVTLIGCIQREKAFRTQVGETTRTAQTELVFTGARPAAKSKTPVAMSGNFTLTGRLEAQLATEVGRSVQITGVIEDEATHDATMLRKTLRPLFVKLWQPAAGACS